MNTEKIGNVSALDHHCGDCGAEFDPSGRRVNVE